MKKTSFYVMIIVLSLTIMPSPLFASEKKHALPSSNSATELPAEVKVMINRLDEIKAMDMSKLSSVEKKELRKEVRTIKKELKSIGKGVYLSIGAIIIIILLLILIL
jgi:biopolymer transport protein ExbD